MALREFTDSRGTAWTAWDVPPHRVYTQKRNGVDRRTHTVPDWTPERRVRQRRMQLRHPELSDGWVCFSCEQEKRRLSPPPPQWDAATDAELEALCGEARQQPGQAQ